MAEPKLDMQPQHRAIVRNILQQHAAGHEAWAFGSRAKGTAKPCSDLDPAIITSEPLSLGQGAALADAFADSELPWRADIVDWATTDPAFRRIIERDRLVVQRKNV
ncbi:MAG: nucleotidyltransferase domain-containing protein [Xanthomonadaceae bacterium]|nr:nucleotidyltransferase domain-containing protein [Xanthomonadaceae bacterium]